VEDLKRDMQHRLIDFEKERQRPKDPSLLSMSKAVPRINSLDSVNTKPSKHTKPTNEQDKDVQRAVSRGETSQSLFDTSKETEAAHDIDNLENTNVRDPFATRQIFAVSNTHTSPGRSLSTSAPADQARNIKSQTQMPQTTTSQGLTSGHKRRDRLLIHLEDASRASSELRFETLALIDMCQMGSIHDSERLRSKYDQAQHVFDKLWAQEKCILESGSLSKTADPSQVQTFDDDSMESSSNKALTISGRSLEHVSRPFFKHRNVFDIPF
jgi:hypothetical protein